MMLTISHFTTGAIELQQQWSQRVSLRDFGYFRNMLDDAARPHGK
jgi:hypothetical protein